MDASSLVEAVDAAVAGGDFDGALALAREACAAEHKALAHQILAGLLFADDDLQGARREYETAFRLWKEAGDRRAAALIAADLADLHSSGLGNRAAGQGWVSRAVRLLEPVGRCVEQGYVELAIIACEADDVEHLERAAEHALELAAELGDAELEVRALADSGLALVTQGRVTEGFARLDEAMAALSAGEVRNPMTAGKSYCALLSACDRAGDMARAEEWTRVFAETMMGPSGGRPRVGYTHCRRVYGSVLCVAGRWQEGEAALLEALGPEGSAYLAHRAEAAASLASLRLVQGRVEEAAEILRPFEDRLPAGEPLARLHLLTGDIDLAEAVARRVLDAVRGDRLRAVGVRSLLVEIALARGDLSSASDHADALQGIAEAVGSPMLAAEAALAAGRIAAARQDAAAARDHLETAASLLVPDQRPLLTGIVALELADLLAGSADRGAAVDHARAALGTFDRLGARPLRDRTDALLRSLGVRSRTTSGTESVATLTEREQQVLDLLRAGLTNPQIGERLFISTKTAEHHVGRVLAKLGVRTRAEAAAVAAARDMTSPTR